MYNRVMKNISELLLRRPYFTLAGILVFFSAVVVGNMTRWSIWFDEAFSAYIVRFGFVDITRYTAVDVHPPLYYWMLKIWTILFGTSEIAFRSMSLVAGIIAIIGMFMLIRQLFRSDAWALVASAAVAFSPIVVRFSHEARMYLVVLAIVVWATYVLVRAVEKNAERKWWIWYAVLLAAGMLTHYFVALAWFGHWAWRFVEYRRGAIKKFFDKFWIWSHVAAVGLFAWWIPIVIRQFQTVQQGFWIPAINAYTPVDYLSNTVLYQQYGEVAGWEAMLFLAVIAAMIVLLRVAWPHLVKRSKPGAYLIAVMTIVPPVLLMLLSMPPLKSSFIDRYVLYSQAFLMVLVALSFAAAYGRVRKARIMTLAAGALVAVGLVMGIMSVYELGNYNKNSLTSIRVREVIELINEKSTTPMPIIAASPWLYYEAVFYENDKHPVYFLDSSTTNYQWGSLKMLEENDKGKILDLEKFTESNRYVWYVDNRLEGNVIAPDETWKQLETVEAYDSIEDNTRYRASLFDTRPTAE